jgi:hypothetical protein
MEEILKAFFSRLSNAIADGVAAGLEKSNNPMQSVTTATPPVEVPTAAAAAPAEDKPKRKRRTAAEIKADKEAAAAPAAAPAAPAEAEPNYEEFMEGIRVELRKATDGPAIKGLAKKWLKDNYELDTFKDCKPADFAVVLKGIADVVASA